MDSEQKIDLWWDTTDKHSHYLYVGKHPVSVGWLNKTKKWWSPFSELPLSKYLISTYGPYDKMKELMEENTRMFFRGALQNRDKE